jgi:hypothetical protein
MKDRRGFLRWCALGALATGLGTLVWRRAPPARPGETCVNQGLCRGCGAYAGCRLPQALSMKEALPR